ncbi:V-type proton ATPase 116 kDa subunit a1 [Nilaparvata lugens]|uniref:V-type proton ATPase 116 kDa subunit a1 n=1 Tax=Nilaparvata lugens TaxID=108931 RepID=UPI00193CD02A|nr:V-type proton ATPase 116 kDa subunit a1 [Nilaparvata lugens]
MEFKEVMRSVEYYFDDPENLPEKSQLSHLFSKAETSPSETSSLEMMMGTINQEKAFEFERTLWRVSMGNVFLHYDRLPIKLEDPETGHQVMKIVFIVVFQGGNLKTKIKKLMESYRAKTYECPDSATERWAVYKDVCDRIENLDEVLHESTLQKRNILEEAAKYVEYWSVMVLKAKATYHTMNGFNWTDEKKKMLVAEFWIPDCHMDDLTAVMDSKKFQFAKPALYKVEVDEMPPTYYNLNKFTQVFQEMVDSYGASTYREVNPAPYLVITFPFLFSVMFGDWGHGMIMTVASLWLIINEKRLRPMVQENEVYRMFYNGRYITLLMGMFSIFSGLMYNECFGRATSLFASGWQVAPALETLNSGDSKSTELAPDVSFTRPYWFGIDPVWHLSKNSIVFKNSIRMKLSIIFGVSQMIFGLYISVENYIYFGMYRKIFTVFLPQLIFIASLFLYLIVLIFMKWYTYGPRRGVIYSSPCAPPILNTFISMILFTSREANENCDLYMFNAQEELQLFLVIVATICIPWLFFVEPIIIIFSGNPNSSKHAIEVSSKEDEQRIQSELSPIESTDISAKHPRHFFQQHEENQTAIDIFIHQGIHAIEFILGSISNTASYLRLWALALAHEQLSEVSWNQVMRRALANDCNIFMKIVSVYLAFIVWAFLTIAILVLMEGLSAFLHALRLHWIEFQSKFYEGNGHKFQPFSFKALIHN